MHSTYAAGHRLSQGSLIISTPMIFHETPQFHYLIRNNAVGTITTKEFIGISRRPHGSFIIQSRLLGKAHTRFELILPFFTYFDNVTGKFVPHYGRMGIYILGNTLVRLTLNSTFVSGHTDTIRNNLYQNFIIFDFGKFEFFCS